MKKSLTFRSIAILIINILLIRVSFSQDPCTSAGSGDITTKSGGTVSGVVVWNATNYYLITGNYNVTGSLTLVDGKFYEFSADKTIVVKNGGSLYISGSNLYAGGNMWAGIKVESGGYLSISAGTGNTYIRDAYKGVESLGDNTNGEAEFHISGTTFCENEVGIYVGPYNYTSMNSEVYNCEFLAPSLKAPKTGEVGDYGIYVSGLGSTASFQIGDDAYYTGSTTFNNFHDLNIAVRSDDSYLLIQDNFINHLIGDHSTITGGYGAFYQTGILAISSNTTNRYLQVGLSPDLVSENMNNVIRNARKGIFCRKHVDVVMYSDSIYSTQISTPNHFYTDTAVHIETDCQDIEAYDLDIENFNCIGMLVKNNSGADPIHLEWNNIFESVSFASDLSPVGIYVTENTTNPVAEIISNQVEGVYRGIILNNIDDAVLNYNIVYYEVHTSGGSPVGDAM